LAEQTGALAIQVDITDVNAVGAAVSRVEAEFGGVDVLVNNAGIAQIKLFTDLTVSDWRTMLDTNLSGAFYVTQAAVRGMIARKYGRIVNIGSMWGKVGASCEVHYSSAKAGLIGLTRALAKELGPSHITVNAIAPAVIDTDMNSSLDGDTLRELVDGTPLMRLGTPADVASAALFLAGEGASFITGDVLNVSGGFVI
jgi:3-oxoacyl-[acyl-carrier protein] reductase